MSCGATGNNIGQVLKSQNCLEDGIIWREAKKDLGSHWRLWVGEGEW